jgi:hypothetical protein
MIFTQHNNADENARDGPELSVRKRGRGRPQGSRKSKPTSPPKDVDEGRTSDSPVKYKIEMLPKPEPTSSHEDVGEGSTSNFQARPKRRGIPPSPTSPHEDVGEGSTSDFPAKRKRGRPKRTSPHEDVGEGGTSDFPAKRKRGKPPKNPA